MKRIVTHTRVVIGLLVLVSSAMLLGGCSSISPQDRNFFYSGWINPNAGR
jgi:hypothetical protein